MPTPRGASIPANAAILFDDEQDNPFPIDKARLDRQLKDNPVPVIWLVDKAKNIDLDYLACFDYALFVDSAPLKLRSQQIQKATQAIQTSAEWREKWTKQTDISLGQIEKAVKVAKLSLTITDASGEVIMDRC